MSWDPLGSLARPAGGVAGRVWFGRFSAAGRFGSSGRFGSVLPGRISPFRPGRFEDPFSVFGP
eukprot:9480804-Pyramimonas_sp.AAC.1